MCERSFSAKGVPTNRFGTKNSYNASLELWDDQPVEIADERITACCQPIQVTLTVRRGFREKKIFFGDAPQIDTLEFRTPKAGESRRVLWEGCPLPRRLGGLGKRDSSHIGVQCLKRILGYFRLQNALFAPCRADALSSSTVFLVIFGERPRYWHGRHHWGSGVGTPKIWTDPKFLRSFLINSVWLCYRLHQTG